MTGRSAAKRALLILVCLLLAGLSVRNAAQRLLDVSDPARAVQFWPADGRSLAALAQNRVVAAGGIVDAKAVELARRSLRKIPRDATPLVVMGFAASAKGDFARAQALMEAARARQPRTDMARFWLLDRYMQSGSYAAGLNEIQPVMALRQGSGPALMDLVGAIATIPAARPALLAKLDQQPRWRPFFFQREASNPALPRGTLASLLLAISANRDPDHATQEQQAVVGSLIDHGNYSTAYNVWRLLLPQGARAFPRGVDDPDFQGRPGSAPFNWTLQSTSDVTVARTGLPNGGSSGLAIAYHAAEPRTLASEVVPVEAGRYGFALRARTTHDAGTDGRIVASVKCTATGASLVVLPLDPLAAPFRLFQADLAVPASCPAVIIEFSGEPGDAFGSVSAQITAVSLTPRP